MPQSRDKQHSEPETPEKKSGWVSRAGLIAGPLAALALFLLPAPSGLEAAGWATAAIALWMAIWWVSEAVPLAATALLPLAAFPLLGVAPISMAAAMEEILDLSEEEKGWVFDAATARSAQHFSIHRMQDRPLDVSEKLLQRPFPERNRNNP